MFSSIVLVVVAVLSTAVTATPARRNTEASPTVTLCTGTIGQGCVGIPTVADNCVNLTGGLSSFNHQVSSVVIPPGFFCTFASVFNCDTSKNVGAFLQNGAWNTLTNVPGTNGQMINFNDKISSYTCSPF